MRSKLKNYQEDKLYKSPHTTISCIEGKKAVEEAIKFCENQKPLHALKIN